MVSNLKGPSEDATVPFGREKKVITSGEEPGRESGHGQAGRLRVKTNLHFFFFRDLKFFFHLNGKSHIKVFYIICFPHFFLSLFIFSVEEDY